MSLKYSTEKIAEFLVFRIENPIINVQITTEVKEALLQEMAGVSSFLILDLSKVRYIDSAGIGALLFGQRIFRIHGGEMALIGLAAPIHNMLKIARLHHTLRIFDTVSDAITQF